MHDYYASRAPEYDRGHLKPERQADLDACGTAYRTRYPAPEASGVLAVESMPVRPSRRGPLPSAAAIARLRRAGPVN